MNIDKLGWGPFFQSSFEMFENEGLKAARVICEHKQLYKIQNEDGVQDAKVSNQFIRNANFLSDYPTVGDWVVIEHRDGEDHATIQALLPRLSSFSRKNAFNKTEEQVMAANIDTVFLVSGLDLNFNLRRIERYLVLAWDCGANPVIILNKSDLCDDVNQYIEEVESIALGVPIIPLSAKDRIGIEALDEYIAEGKTVVFLGSSGTGKSTLINGLLGEDRLQTGSVRKGDFQGRHTTTSRELIILPNGGIVIDTPGIRELQLWTDEKSLTGVFSEIEELSHNCKFRNCQHVNEPDCAIQNAIQEGVIDEDRFKNYLKMKAEIKHLEARQDQKLNLAQKKSQKELSKLIKKVSKNKKRKFKG